MATKSLRIQDIKKIEVDLQKGVTFKTIQYPEIKNDILRQLCRHTGILEKWKMLMRSLDVDEDEIYATECDYKESGIKETVYNALRKWRESRKSASLADLAEALEECKIKNLTFHDLTMDQTEEAALYGIDRAVEFPCSKTSEQPHRIGSPKETLDLGDETCCNGCLVKANESRKFKFWVTTDVQQLD